MGSRRVAALALAAVSLAACGETATTPTALVRTYESAIFSRDGGKLCGTFTPKLRQVLGERIARSAGGSSFDCGRFYREAIGYPHENMDRRYLSGKLLTVGTPQRIHAGGADWVGVPATTRIAFEYTGYTLRSGERGAVTLHETVWLTRSHGRWGVVKPSATLAAATNADTAFLSGSIAQVNAPPPDPDYTMNRAERTAWEAADYRSSFRGHVAHALHSCSGKTVTAVDPPGDVYTYPAGSVMNPKGLKPRDDILEVTLQVTPTRICVAVTFATSPGDMIVGFTPRSPGVFLPEFDVELVGDRVRAGTLTSGYMYFRGGERLRRAGVGAIAVHGRTVEFAADPTVLGETLSPNLEWSVMARAPAGYDKVDGGR